MTLRVWLPGGSAPEKGGIMRSNGLLTDLLISTLWFALFYFALGQMRKPLFGYFAHIAQLFEFFP